MRKALSFILIICMMLGMMVSVHADDEPSDWAVEEVKAAISSGLVPQNLQSGYTSPVTRGEVAEMFMILLEKSAGKSVEALIEEKGAVMNEGKFEDTDDPNVYAANSLGIINGTSSSKFSPDGTLKRAQIAAIINRVASVLGFETEGYTHHFEDITGNYSWVDAELGWPVENGIIKGVSSTRFSPGGDLTVEQAILITYRAYEVLLNPYVVYVSPDGSGNGTLENPFGNIADAVASVRNIDKSSYGEVQIRLLSGEYFIDSTILLEAEDAGTENCKVRFIGENGAVIAGGIIFGSDKFEKASGDTLEYFPEEVREKLVMINLGEFGYTGEDIANMKKNNQYFKKANLISVNGKQMNLARYPNEGWIEITGGYFIDKNGNYTEKDDNQKGDDIAVQSIIDYGEQYKEKVLSWDTSIDSVFVRAHYRFIWAADHSVVTEFFKDSPEMLVPYVGGYFPREGGILFWYNIPAELDVPGEFYIDKNAVLYYYPEEDFEESEFTIPLLDDALLTIEGADHIAFENITFKSSLKNGVNLKANDVLFNNCRFYDIYDKGLVMEGNDIVFTNNEIYNVGNVGVRITGGDIPTLTDSGIVVSNNCIHNWCNRSTMAFGIDVMGVGALISHNEVYDSTDLGICAEGPLNTVEYNFVHDTCRFFADGGTVSIHGKAYGTVCRYNLVVDTGYESRIDIVGVQAITADMDCLGCEVYGNITYNCTGSGITFAYTRDGTIRNNLLVKCGRYSLAAICPAYATCVANGVVKEYKANADMQSEIWQERFPELVGIHWRYDPENSEDPMFVKAPANNYVADNYYYFDKAYRTDPNGAYVTRTSDFESYYMTFSDITVPNTGDGTLQTYSSRRDTVSLREALEAANEAVGVMTFEQLESIGIEGKGIGNYEFGD